jgi:hypothetical protein
MTQFAASATNRRVPQVSLLRPGIRATDPKWKLHTPLCHPARRAAGAKPRDLQFTFPEANVHLITNLTAFEVVSE